MTTSRIDRERQAIADYADGRITAGQLAAIFAEAPTDDDREVERLRWEVERQERELRRLRWEAETERRIQAMVRRIRAL